MGQEEDLAKGMEEMRDECVERLETCRGLYNRIFMSGLVHKEIHTIEDTEWLMDAADTLRGTSEAYRDQLDLLDEWFEIQGSTAQMWVVNGVDVPVSWYRLFLIFLVETLFTGFGVYALVVLFVWNTVSAMWAGGVALHNIPDVVRQNMVALKAALTEIENSAPAEIRIALWADTAP